MSTNTIFQNRLVFLDNIRYLIVLLVVVLHVGVGYSHLVPWWYVVDSNPSVFFDILSLWLDGFLMPVLFFLAGYFALASIQQKTVGTFLVTKWKRLLIPWFFGVFFLVPVMPYIYHYTRTTIPVSFGEFWLAFVKSAADLKIVVASPNDFSNEINTIIAFNHHHLWFISLLLFFFIGFALLYHIKSKFSKPTPPHDCEDTSIPSIWIVLFTAGIVISFSVILVNYFIHSFAWTNIYNVLVFQPTRLPLYLGFFWLGIYAYSKNWFTKHNLPGSLRVWFIACIILSLILLEIVINIYTEENSIYLIIAHGFVRTFQVMAWLVFLILFAHRYWNQPSKINQNLARNSYGIYLIHLPIVVLFQCLFFSINMSIFFKFGIILLLSTLLSYGVNHYLIRHIKIV